MILYVLKIISWLPNPSLSEQQLRLEVLHVEKVLSKQHKPFCNIVPFLKIVRSYFSLAVKTAQLLLSLGSNYWRRVKPHSFY
jgi:hypothetical protein